MKFTIESTNQKISQFAGLLPLFEYIQKMGIISILSSFFPKSVAKNTVFYPNQIFMAVLSNYLVGNKTFSEIEQVTSDPLVESFLKLKRKISRPTLSAFLESISNHDPKKINTFITRYYCQKIMPTIPLYKPIVIDIDSTVESVCGHQAGTGKGFNTQHKGHHSFHPLLAFCYHTQTCVQAWIRPGDTASATDADNFLKEFFKQLETDRKIIIRADSGFCGEPFIAIIDKANQKFVVKLKTNKRLQKLVLEYDKGWKRCSKKGLEGLFYRWMPYQADSWKKQYQVIAYRIEVKENDESETKDSSKKKMVHIPIENTSKAPEKKWNYFYLVSNTDWNPEKLALFYRQRGTCEQWIGQVKNQMNACRLRSQKNENVTEICFGLGVLAYNISLWYRIEKWPLLKKQSIHRFLITFIRTACKLCHSGRNMIVKVYHCVLRAPPWDKLRRKQYCSAF